MAGPDDKIPRVDSRGTTFLVPLGIGAVLVVIAVLMIFRDSGEAPPEPRSGGGTTITQPSPGQK